MSENMTMVKTRHYNRIKRQAGELRRLVKILHPPNMVLSSMFPKAADYFRTVRSELNKAQRVLRN